MPNKDIISLQLKGLKELMEEKFESSEKLVNERFEQNVIQHNEINDNLHGKANKWVEKFTSGLIGTVLFAVLGALIGLVLIKPTMVSMVYIYNLIA